MKINKEIIEKTLAIWNDKFEVRILTDLKYPNGSPRNFSGIFDDKTKVIPALEAFEFEFKGVYLTLNEFNLPATNKITTASSTVKDDNITTRKFILVDLDPKREKGTNSTPEMKSLCKMKASQIITDLKEDFPNIVRADSGNGTHLLIPISIPTTNNNKVVIEDFLKYLSSTYSDNDIIIDTAVHNASRITRFYGTYNCKTEKPILTSIMHIPNKLERHNINDIVNYIRKTFDPDYSFTSDGIIDNQIVQNEKIVNADYALSRNRGADNSPLNYDKFNKAQRPEDVLQVLLKNSWTVVYENDIKIGLMRPGGERLNSTLFKKTLHKSTGELKAPLIPKFYVFSNETPFTPNKSYIPSEIWKIYNEPIPQEYLEPETPEISDHLACDLLTMEFPEVQYIVPDYIPQGYSILFGRPKSGKSYFALNLLMCLSNGWQVLGKDTQAIGTCFLSLEDNKRRLKRRMKEFLSNFPQEYQYISKNFRYLTREDGIPKINAGGYDFLRNYFIKNPDIKLVVIDTLKKFTKVSRNVGYEEEAEISELFLSLANEFSISFIVIHHSRKGSIIESEDVLESMHGSIAISGGAETILKLSRNKKNTKLQIIGKDVEDTDLILQFNNGLFNFLGNADGIIDDFDWSSIVTEDVPADVFLSSVKDKFMCGSSKAYDIIRQAKTDKKIYLKANKYYLC